MSVITERLAHLDTITLEKGSHSDFESGHCAMEVVSWLAGEGFTDAPTCASPVLRSFTIEVNDRWDTAQRQKLRPLLPRLVGTADDGQDEARSYLALDWLIRSFTPAWLDLADLSVEAQSLRGLRRIVDLVTAKAAAPVVREAQSKAAATWDAAGDAAWAAARDAAWDAARVAARVAAWNAAGAAAWAAAWVAAWDAARDAAWVAARDAARVAAWNAAGDALQPTIKKLQASALELLDKMIDPAKAAA